MKNTTKTMTLAGTVYQSEFNDPMATTTILEYTNVLDINRAWKVRSFECWLTGDDETMNIVGDCLLSFRFSLATDDVPNADDLWLAGDNRMIGFKEVAYSMQERSYKGAAYTGAPVQNLNVETYMKPDHVVQTRLDIAYGGMGSDYFVENAFFDFNYIIELEEVTISPTESIVFNIKSKAQDLSA